VARLRRHRRSGRRRIARRLFRRRDGIAGCDLRAGRWRAVGLAPAGRRRNEIAIVVGCSDIAGHGGGFAEGAVDFAVGGEWRPRIGDALAGRSVTGNHGGIVLPLRQASAGDVGARLCLLRTFVLVFLPFRFGLCLESVYVAELILQGADLFPQRLVFGIILLHFPQFVLEAVSLHGTELFANALGDLFQLVQERALLLLEVGVRALGDFGKLERVVFLLVAFFGAVGHAGAGVRRAVVLRLAL